MDVLRTKTTIAFLLLLAPIIIFLAQPTLADTVVCCVDLTEGTCTEGMSSDDLCPEPIDGFCSVAKTPPPEEQSLCRDGCCCAGAGVSNPGDWNSDSENTVQTLAQCTATGTDHPGSFNWDANPDGLDCAVVCEGTVDPGDPDLETVTITVIVQDEEGAPAPDVTIRVLGQIKQTNNEGRTTFTVLEGDNPITVRADKDSCADSTQVTPDQNREVELQLDCEQTSCTVDDLPTITRELIRGTNNISLTMTAGPGCPFEEYNVLVFEKNPEGDLVPVSGGPPPTTAHTATHTNVEPETEYCYRVRAVYTGTTKESQEPTCVTTGVLECMLNEDARWCEQRDYNDPESVAKKLRCDENNQLIQEECDSPDEMCALADGIPVCVERAQCERCNGLFGLLSNLAHKINIPAIGGSFWDCSSQQVAPYCYEDKAPYVTDKYKERARVTSCEDYQSRAACENNNNLPEECSWKDINNIEGSAELNLGVCQPTNEETPIRCDACNDLYGGCSQDLCTEIGIRNNNPSECYFDELRNNLVNALGCIQEEQVACRFYDNEQDCTGGVSDGVRINTITHEVTNPSSDVFSIGVCRWNDNAGFCYKDADGRADVADVQHVDDCEGRVLASGSADDCYRDATPPTTALNKPTTPIRASAIGSVIHVSVSDNQYSPQYINTYFCIDFDNTCYPTHESLVQATAEIINDITIGEDEQVYLRYYSQDYARNLEEVQSETIQLLNTGEALVESITIR